jgi:hypothetical protein
LPTTFNSANSQQSTARPYFAAAAAAAAILLLLDLPLLLLLDAAAVAALLAPGATPKTAAPSFARGSSNARHCGSCDVLLLLRAAQDRAAPAKLEGN